VVVVSALPVDKVEKKTAIAKKVDIPASKLSTITANRCKRRNNIDNFGPESKSARPCKNEELDRKAYEWFTSMRSANISFSGPILQDRAKTIALKLGMDNFRA
jgi:hypothetical protein